MLFYLCLNTLSNDQRRSWHEGEQAQTTRVGEQAVLSFVQVVAARVWTRSGRRSAARRASGEAQERRQQAKRAQQSRVDSARGIAPTTEQLCPVIVDDCDDTRALKRALASDK